MNFTGTPVTALMESAAPPRASPSILVRISPVRPTRSWKAAAALTASWPVMASTTKMTSSGFTAFLISASSSMSSSSICSRPSVSMMAQGLF